MQGRAFSTISAIGFTLIRLYPQNDEVVADLTYLLPLITKDTRVRKRFKYQADDYGLDQPIAVLRKGLGRAKKEENGCLFIGAICNDGEYIGLPYMIVSEGGLGLILQIADWFRM